MARLLLRYIRHWGRCALLLAVGLCPVVPAFAQHGYKQPLYKPRNEGRPIRFGIGLSFNTMDFRLINSGKEHRLSPGALPRRYVGVVNGLHPGFNVNALVRFRLTEQMHIRALPGICFGQRDIEMYIDNGGPEHGALAAKIPIESAFIEMPMLFVYSAVRVSNARPYVCAGVNLRADMAAFKTPKIEDNQFLRLRKFDLAYEVGFGYEFYFPLFKMAPEIKWSGGFLNVLSPKAAEGYEHFHSAVKHLASQVLIFSLIFE